MTSAFSSAESAVLERTVDVENSSQSPATLADIWSAARLAECSDWIHSNGYRKVCLQFADELLPFSVRITLELKTECRRRQKLTVASSDDADGRSKIEIYILGDTSYGSCCVDEVAASHVDADAIIHFGHACLSRVVRLPLMHVFYHYRLDADAFVNAVRPLAYGDASVFVFYNVGYYYELEILKNAIHAAGLSESVRFAKLALDSEPDTLCWQLNGEDLSSSACVYVGRDDQTLFNVTLSVSPVKEWHLYDPSSSILQPKSPATSAWLRRRNFCIEKCKDARALGIVVGTLATRGYLEIVKHLQALARHRQIRTYLISVGKVNPAKLANFMEIDCFVLIGCPENDLFTSREFYKPLLSVYEVEMALNEAWNDGGQAPAYSLAFRDVLPEGRLFRDFADVDASESDVSLVSGRVRNVKLNEEVDGELSSTAGAVVLKRNYQLMGADAAGSGGALQNRTWTGLDAALGKHEPARIEKGRSGIAMRYEENVESIAGSK